MSDWMLLGQNMIRTFDPKRTDFLKWLNRFEHVADFLKINDNAKAAFLLIMLEPYIYGELLAKLVPKNPSDFSYEELVPKLQEMYSTLRGIDAVKHRLIYRTQIETETVEMYAQTLKKLISQCNYGDKSNSMLLSKFVSGLKSKRARMKLTDCSNLTIDQAIEIAKGFENPVESHDVN